MDILDCEQMEETSMTAINCIKQLYANCMESAKKKIEELEKEIANKNKLLLEKENRIDDLSLNHKKYNLKIDALEKMLKDNDVMVFTDRIMDDAKRDIEDAEKEAKIYKDCNNCLSMLVKHFILEHISHSGEGYEFCDDGIDCSRVDFLKPYIEEILEDMNEDDWNGDDKESRLVYSKFRNTIEFRHIDMNDSDSDSDA